MIAARILGKMTFHRRCHHVAPSTFAASSMSSDTWARPASSSSDMNGVVFQISEAMIAIIDDQYCPNQLKSSAVNGSQLLTKPLVLENANCHAKPETTVMTP